MAIRYKRYRSLPLEKKVSSIKWQLILMILLPAPYYFLMGLLHEKYGWGSGDSVIWWMWIGFFIIAITWEIFEKLNILKEELAKPKKIPSGK